MNRTLETVAVTGVAGRVGSVVRAALRDEVSRLVLTDRAPLRPRPPGEEFRQADLHDAHAVATALDGTDAVVHLGGVSDEAPLPELLDGNVLGTYHVLEAARRRRIRRVVLASSNRLTGMYPSTQTVAAALPPRPDGLYGVSKVAVEALGRLYADKFGLDVVCLRIGSLEDRPSEPRHLATWLSPRDCAGFVRAALTAKIVGFHVCYAVSANTRRFWDLAAGEYLGYRPRDDAERYVHEIPAPACPGEQPQGGDYAGAEYTLVRAGLDSGAAENNPVETRPTTSGHPVQLPHKERLAPDVSP